MATPARRTLFTKMAGHLYPQGDRQDFAPDSPDVDAAGVPDAAPETKPAQPMSPEEMASKMYADNNKNNDGLMPTKAESDSCHKPEDEFDRITRMAHDQNAHPDMGPLEYAGKFWISGAKGMYSLVHDALAGSRDAADYLGNLSGINGEEAQNKAHTQLDGLLDATKKGGAAAYNGLKMYYTSPEVRDAVNRAIVKAAPEAWRGIKQGFWNTVDDPERTGRATGRFALSMGISKIDEIPKVAKYFVTAMALIGNLDATDKNLQSKIDGMLLGADYADRSKEPGRK
ncbi:MAG TPA: hypothetical protein VIU46_04950 [Gallionellaceae bacterium]